MEFMFPNNKLLSNYISITTNYKINNYRKYRKDKYVHMDISLLIEYILEPNEYFVNKWFQIFISIII